MAFYHAVPLGRPSRGLRIACTDLATLGRWIERAMTAPSASEAISEP